MGECGPSQAMIKDDAVDVQRHRDSPWHASSCGVGNCPILFPLVLCLSKATISSVRDQLLSLSVDPISNNRGPLGSWISLGSTLRPINSPNGRSQPRTHLATERAPQLVLFQVVTRDVVACQAIPSALSVIFIPRRATHNVSADLNFPALGSVVDVKETKLRGTCRRRYQDSTAKIARSAFLTQISGFLWCFLSVVIGIKSL